MTRFTKLLLGIASAWPLVYMALFFLFVLLMIALAPGSGEPGAIFGVFFAFVIIIHFITIFLILGLQIFYIVNAIKNNELSQNAKIAWILGMFFGGFLLMPIYWYMNIWKDTENEDYQQLNSGDQFDPANRFDAENKTYEPVQREPHSWK